MTTLLIHAVAPWLLVSLPLPQPTFSPPDACALLTQAEAETILGTSIAPPTKGGSGECHYGEEGSSAEIVVYPMMLGFRSKEEFHAFVVEDTKHTIERMKEALKKSGATVKETVVEPVSGLGDDAYYVDPSLLVLSHERVLNITAANRDQAVAVAKKVLPRFK